MNPQAPSTEVLYTLFGAELLSFVRSRSASDGLAEDILQQAFLRAHESLEAGTLPERPRAWLYQIARNLVADAWRRDSRQRSLTDALTAASPSVPSEASSSAAAPEDDVSALLARALPQFISQIDAPYRQALQLTEIGRLSHAQAAEQQGVSLTCMKTRVRRARKQVLDALQRCCQFEVDTRGRVIACTPHAAGTNSDCG